MADEGAMQLGEPLNIFGQNPRLSRLYTQLCFAFPLANSSIEVQATVIDLLQLGLERLITAIPWVAGEVIRDDNGIFSIRISSTAPAVISKDLTKELPSFDELREARFPFRLLDENVIAPRQTLSDTVEETAPVFILQANLVNGGLLLVFNAQHNCMDLRGQAQIIHYFSKSCRAETLTHEELRTATLPRLNLIKSFDNVELPPKLDARLTPFATSEVERDLRLTLRNLWVYFLFSSQALMALKDTAVETMTSAYVSTDDALSAFVWQAVIRARMERLEVNDLDSFFERQVDARKHLKIPGGYTGNVVYKSKTTMKVQEVINQPLGVVASRLREALNPVPSIEYQVRAAASALEREMQESKGISDSIHTSLPLTGIRLSSWAKEECYDFDFGGFLGKAEAVRRPSFNAWEGLAYFLPKALNGEIAVALSLREDDIERLRSDKLFRQYGEYIG